VTRSSRPTGPTSWAPICDALGLGIEPAPSQVVARDRHATLVQAIATLWAPAWSRSPWSCGCCVCRVTGALVGIARSASDFSYVTYLSDIAVHGEHQRRRIGRALIDATRREAPSAKLVLLSAPAATEYYPHIGFTQHHSAWIRNP
jgi:GNAT superfamily N-acetyltransferase